MKKYIVILFLLLITGCSLGVASTPREKVKEFLDKYKNQDSEVLNNLDEIVSSEYSGDFAERYKNIMKNQYKNMTYKITDEIIEGDDASVIAEITVFDYSSIIKNANTYLTEHKKEFLKDNINENSITSDSIDNDKFLEYKFGLLENASDTKTYSIEFILHKNDNTWEMDSLSESDIEQIHGLYDE